MWSEEFTLLLFSSLFLSSCFGENPRKVSLITARESEICNHSAVLETQSLGVGGLMDTNMCLEAIYPIA